MTEKIGRNDPCPCGSGKKYKQCCLSKQYPALPGKRKFKATLISSKAPAVVEESTEQPPVIPEGPDLIQRAYGNMLHNLTEDEYNK